MNKLFSAIAALTYVLFAVFSANIYGQALYDKEYPFMNYSTAERHDAISKLQNKIDDGEIEISYDSNHGYLKSVLDALEIDISSQVLVFSQTSLQSRNIRPSRPRAVYFNDEVYVAWVQESEALEIGSMDPTLGPVFFTLSQQKSDAPTFNPETEKCMRCHDSYSLSGGGTPRFIMGSGYHGKMGEMVSHEGRIMTDNATPLQYRWGGWYVTGTHGEQLHLGNTVVTASADLQPESLKKNGNLLDLTKRFNTEPYLKPYSDIVALLIIEHQVEVQNLISRSNYLTQKALQEPMTENINSLLEELYEQLVRSLMFADAATLQYPVVGVSGYTDIFSAQGPTDSQERSLRELNLNDRVFKYPLSYLIYSEAFSELHEKPKKYVQQRISLILKNGDKSFENLTPKNREATLGILRETIPSFIN